MASVHAQELLHVTSPTWKQQPGLTQVEMQGKGQSKGLQPGCASCMEAWTRMVSADLRHEQAGNMVWKMLLLHFTSVAEVPAAQCCGAEALTPARTRLCRVLG